MQQRISRRALFTLLAVLALESFMTGSQVVPGGSDPSSIRPEPLVVHAGTE